MRQVLADIREILRLPRVEIDLMRELAAGNDPFYLGMVDDFFRYVRRRHPKLPLVRAFEHGVALCRLPPSADEYFMMIEASARRNCKKAMRSGYVFRRIDFNDHLADIGDIRRSTDQRQGEVTGYMADDDVEPCRNPPSRSDTHDYAYYGVLKDDRLVAYGGCLVSGEICMIEHILGHARYLGDGVVPMLIVSMGQEMIGRHPKVKYYAYGTYYGGGPTMRRFKKKFRFLPHRVKWRE